MSRSKKDSFNAVILWALAAADESSPLPASLSYDDIPDDLRSLLAEVANREGEQVELWYESIKFLQREGFITARSPFLTSREFDFVYLTKETMSVLGTVPQALSGKTIGGQLKDVAKDAGKVGASAAVAETVGVIIGTAARTFSGGS